MHPYITVITVLILVFLASFARSDSKLKIFRQQVDHFEKTGNADYLTGALVCGAPFSDDLIQELATIDLVPDEPQALSRRLVVLQRLKDCGCGVNFRSLSLADCMEVEILSFLLKNDAQSAENDDLYRALSNGDFEYANLFLEMGRMRISVLHLEDLLQSTGDNLDLREWLINNFLFLHIFEDCAGY